MATQAKRDYYEVLGVTRTASSPEIEQAHAELVARIRQDRDETVIDRLLEANRARAVLSDPLSRGQYDQFGHAGDDNVPKFSGGFDPSRLPASDGWTAVDEADLIRAIIEGIVTGLDS